jgi:hypothetical protein
MNVLGPGPKDKARPWTNYRYSRGAAGDYGSEGWEFESLRALSLNLPSSPSRARRSLAGSSLGGLLP